MRKCKDHVFECVECGEPATISENKECLTYEIINLNKEEYKKLSNKIELKKLILYKADIAVRAILKRLEKSRL